MNDLLILQTQETPQITFTSLGNLEITGISIPENVNNFYKPIFDWLDRFGDTKPKKITLTLDLEYMNTSSTRVVLQILNKLKAFNSNGSSLSIVWKYEEDDADMKELGEDLEDSCKIVFDFFPKKVIA
jgi:hypothetical protein